MANNRAEHELWLQRSFPPLRSWVERREGCAKRRGARRFACLVFGLVRRGATGSRQSRVQVRQAHSALGTTVRSRADRHDAVRLAARFAPPCVNARRDAAATQWHRELGLAWARGFRLEGCCTVVRRVTEHDLLQRRARRRVAHLRRDKKVSRERAPGRSGARASHRGRRGAHGRRADNDHFARLSALALGGRNPTQQLGQNLLSRFIAEAR